MSMLTNRAQHFDLKALNLIAVVVTFYSRLKKDLKMLSYLPLLMLIILFVIQIRMSNNLYKHLAKKYPKQWQALSKNTLGNDVRGNLGESLKHGFFSTINDQKLRRFNQFKRFNICTCVAIGVAGLINAYYY